MQDAMDSQNEIALFLEGLKGQLSINYLEEIDQMINQHFEDEESNCNTTDGK